MIPERMDLEGADDDQLDLFYLVDRVLDEIELAKQAALGADDSTSSDDSYNMPAASPDFDSYDDLMEQIEISEQYASDQSINTDSSPYSLKSADMRQHYQYQHPVPFAMATDDVIATPQPEVETEMDRLYLQQCLSTTQYNDLIPEKGIPNVIENSDCQYSIQDVYNRNVQDILSSQVHVENGKIIGSTDQHVDLNFPEIPDLSAHYIDDSKYFPESEHRRLNYSDDDSNDTYQSDFKGWTRCHPESWTTSDVLDWLFYCADKIALEIGEDCSNLRAEAFSNVTGEILCKMGPEDFQIREPKFGLSFYNLFRNLLRDGVSFSRPVDTSLDQSNHSDSSYTEPNHPTSHFSGLTSSEVTAVQGHQFINAIQSNQNPSNTSQEMYQPFFQFEYGNQTVPVTAPNSVESLISQSYPNSLKPFENLGTYTYQYYHHLPSDVTSARAKYETGVTPVRRRPGRPRTKTIQTEEEIRAQRAKKLKSQHLWEFIYELLNNPTYNPSILKWENPANGVFRFIQSETVAQLWGTLKSNENMTYEKLSRAMRHYYKRGIMERVEGRRLVYKYSLSTLEKMREKHGMRTT